MGSQPRLSLPHLRAVCSLRQPRSSPFLPRPEVAASSTASYSQQRQQLRPLRQRAVCPQPPRLPSPRLVGFPLLRRWPVADASICRCAPPPRRVRCTLQWCDTDWSCAARCRRVGRPPCRRQVALTAFRWWRSAAAAVCAGSFYVAAGHRDGRQVRLGAHGSRICFCWQRRRRGGAPAAAPGGTSGGGGGVSAAAAGGGTSGGGGGSTSGATSGARAGSAGGGGSGSLLQRFAGGRRLPLSCARALLSRGSCHRTQYGYMDL